MFDLIPFERSDDWMNQFFRAFQSNFPVKTGSVPCVTDIRDEGDHYELEAEMPGYKKEEIHLSIDGDCLTLQAAHEEKQEQQSEKRGTYLRRECRTASVTRSFDVSGIDTSAIKARYEDGILKLTLPKKAAQQPVTKRISIQ